MSIDTYFCFCCLSTDDLLPLYGFDSDENYAVLLAELFAVEPFKQDYEDDGYICSKCALAVKEFQLFQRQMKATITILQANGLIYAEKRNNLTVIKKASSLNLEDKKKCLLDENDLKTNEEDLKPDDTGQPPSSKAAIKIEHGVEILNKYLEITQSKLTNTDPTSKDSGTTLDYVKDEKEVNKLECIECNKELPNMYTYHRHMNKHYPNYICDNCGHGFITQKKLKRHKIAHNPGPFICDVCDAEFRNYNTLVSHRQRKHNTNTSKTTKNLKTGNYKCDICEKIYTTYGSLYTHMRSSHKKHKRYFCCLCAEGFYHKQDLYAHENTHTRMNMYQCGLCDKSYLRKKALNVHMKLHTNDRRYICNECGKAFIQKCTLIAHVRIHNTVAKK